MAGVREWVPSLAAVRPRVVRPGSELPRLLEEEVAELLLIGKPTSVVLWGPIGSGKATAMAHLAAVFADEPRLHLANDNDTTSPDAIVNISVLHRRPGNRLAFQLQPWTDDDAIEYMLRKHPDDVSRVLTMWHASEPHDLLDWPGLSARVLDELTAKPHLKSARAALVDVLADRIGDRYTTVVNLAQQLEYGRRPTEMLGWASPADVRDLNDVFGSSTARCVLLADCMLQYITLQFRREHMHVGWNQEMQRAVRDAMHTNEPSRREILALAEQPRRRQKAHLYSALCLWQPGYRPTYELRGNLDGAWLQQIDLHDHCIRASLERAQLDGADLSQVIFDRCSLVEADLRGALADHTQFKQLTGSSLKAARLQAPHSTWIEARLNGAMFRRANLENADLTDARLAFADLRSANLSGANLSGARLTRAQVAEANLSNASLTGTKIIGVDFRGTRLDDIDLRGAQLSSCSFEGCSLPAPRAALASFSNCDLTASHWRQADLRDCTFAKCGLAEVQWEGADLRGADLRGATFHLGNSRSGLIDSTTPSEGSRTGYYTDESLEDRFQTPEDVRKANLRNCDLRGAQILGVDFYLVDLRGAKLDPFQRRWLMRCRAILDRPDAEPRQAEG